MNPDFFRAIVLKTAFRPEPLRRAQAALLYVALNGDTFTADCLPGEVTAGDTTLAGCAVGSLSTLGLIECVGRVKSPAKSRNGSRVNAWRLTAGRMETVKTWLKRNGFPLEERQQEMAL